MSPVDLLLMLGGMSLLGGCLLLGVGLAQRSAALMWWSLGYFVGSFGLAFIIWGYSFGVWVSSGIGSGFVLVAYGLMWTGIRSLSGVQEPRRWVIPLGLAWCLVILIPPLYRSLLLRTIVFGVFAAAYMLALAREIAKVPGRPQARVPLMVLALLHGGFYLAKSTGLAWARGSEAADLFWMYATAVEGMFFIFCDAFLVMSLARSLREKALVDEAYTDFLTGVLTRRRFTALAESMLETGVCTALVLDIDHFKSVNDAFGHAAGDELLRQLGRICRETIRERDLAGRLGGDEFAVIVAGSADEAAAIANRIREAFAATASSLGWGASASVGVSGAHSRPVSLEILLAEADHDLYGEKKRRGTRFGGFRVAG